MILSAITLPLFMVNLPLMVEKALFGRSS